MQLGISEPLHLRIINELGFKNELLRNEMYIQDHCQNFHRVCGTQLLFYLFILAFTSLSTLYRSYHDR